MRTRGRDGASSFDAGGLRFGAVINESRKRRRWRPAAAAAAGWSPRRAIGAAAGAAVEALETRLVFGYFSADAIDQFPLPLDSDCPPVPVLPLADRNGGAQQASTTEQPVRHFDGLPVIASADLSSQGFGFAWGHTRAWTGLNDGSLNGNGWSVAELPYLVVAGGVNGSSGGINVPTVDGTSGVLSGTGNDHRISVVAGGGNTLTFSVAAPGSSSSYLSHAPWGGRRDSLEWDTTNNLMRLTDEKGGVTEFHDVFRAGGDSANHYYATDPNRPMPRSLAHNLPQLYGRFKRFIAANGTTIVEAAYDGNGYLTSVTRRDTANSTRERYRYDHTGDAGFPTLTNDLVATAGDTAPRMIARVTLERSTDSGGNWATVRRVDYTYYTGRVSAGGGGFVNDPHGRLGDLKLVEVKDKNGALVDAKYYRYYKMTGEGNVYSPSPGPTNKPATTGGPGVVQFGDEYPKFDPLVSNYYHRFVMSGLKAVVEGPALARLATEVPGYMSATDEEITPYVNHFFRYERWADHVGTGAGDNYEWRTGYRLGTRYRVIEEVAQGTGCSSCSGGQGRYRFQYHANYANDDAVGYDQVEHNVWRLRTTEFLPNATNDLMTATLGTTSIQSSGSTATIYTDTAGFAIGDTVTIEGAPESAYNGTFDIIGIPSYNRFEIELVSAYTGMSSGPATLTNLDRIAAAEWDDNDRVVVYTNEVGLPMLRVEVDANGTPTDADDREYLTYYRYDDDGRLTFTAHPSALSGYSESLADLVDFDDDGSAYVRQDRGLIEMNVYTTGSTGASGTSAGSVHGYLSQTRALRGAGDLFDVATSANPGVLLSSQNYYAVTAGGATIYPVASHTVYRNASPTGSGALTTNYAYTWHSGTVAMKSATVTPPTVGEGQNGRGVADAGTTVHDKYGRVTWAKDAGGFMTRTAYDDGTGAVLSHTVDVDTGVSADEPAGWTTPSDGGLHLETTTGEIDELGRPLTTYDPRENAWPGTGSVTHFVYDDANHERRVYAGWDASTKRPTGTTLVAREDWAGGYTELLTMTAAPATNGAGLPTGAESVSGVQSLTRSYVNGGGQVIHIDNYFGGGFSYGTGTNVGTLGTHFYRTTYGYDGRGRLDEVVNPEGTITRTVFDGLGRQVSTWVGTSDAGWTPTNAASMTKLADYFYDTYDAGRTVQGDKNLTRVISYPNGSTAPRVEDLYYDWRNRLVATKAGVLLDGTGKPDAAGETNSASVQRLITYHTLDNLGRTVGTETFDGDGVAMTNTTGTNNAAIDVAESAGAGDGVPDAPTSSARRSKVETDFDDQGRAWQSKAYAVDPADGGLLTSGTNTLSLKTWFWYDERGALIKTQEPGGLATKFVVDGAGRVVRQYTTDAGGDPDAGDEDNWWQAASVEGDRVLEQVETEYDESGNAVFLTTRRRFHNETNTAGLGDVSGTPKARVSFAAFYYDRANRLTDTVDVGTNGGSGYRWDPLESTCRHASLSIL